MIIHAFYPRGNSTRHKIRQIRVKRLRFVNVSRENVEEISVISVTLSVAWLLGFRNC